MTNFIVCIVGNSNSGKTTLIEKLIHELTLKGYRVGTIKHDIHGFDIDKEGKDSWRHKKAGAILTILSSPSKVAVIKDSDHDAQIDELIARYVNDVDIILVEGFKKSNKPKIEIYRKELSSDIICNGDDNLIAIATDSSHDINIPQFNINDAKGLAIFLEHQYLSQRINPFISLEVDGKVVSMKPFLQKMLINSIMGMISALEGCSQPHSVTIKINNDCPKNIMHKL